ncbi:hypothetical protein PHMEG_00015460 [Phytophthora megakarya]|uniref:Uncharacterized protein n=1 Tax=Phytophthora megakarya TaxID=4795 RepID=A0A225W1Q0_9STRA|nr:hypothetical protein PHMEG_00015460 [Phytophthora megakarya]
MPYVSVNCPVCGLDLAAASLKNNVVRQLCLNRKVPSLKVRLLQEARASKLAYDRWYAIARRGVLEGLALHIVQRGSETVSTTDSPNGHHPSKVFLRRSRQHLNKVQRPQ